MAAAVTLVRGRDLGQQSDAVDRSERKDEFIKRKKTIKRRVTILYNSCHRDRPDTKLVPGTKLVENTTAIGARISHEHIVRQPGRFYHRHVRGRPVASYLRR